MLALSTAGLTAAIGFLIARRWPGRTGAIYALLIAWLIGIVFAVFVAAMVRGEGHGAGAEGEHVDESREAIIIGFWIALFGSGIGALFGVRSRHTRGRPD
jgi:hypothetical protein